MKKHGRIPQKKVIQMDKKLTDLDSRIVKFLSKQERVELAYLFGSVAEGNAGKLSDILLDLTTDAVILYDKGILSEEMFYIV